MSFLGKLFEKKNCSFCGEQIKFLGNRKVEDGNMCKDCASKLSPWFSERRSSTVEEIKRQLEYREGNKQAVESFSTTRQIGSKWRIFIDDAKGNFIVYRGKDYKGANPDVIPLSSVTAVNTEIEEDKDELKKKNAEGKEESYFPPRYEYSYSVDLRISVNHEFISDITFNMEDDIVIEAIGNQTPDIKANRKYMEAVETADTMKAALLRTDVEPAPVKQAIKCPYCGATTVTTEKGCCEYCGAAITK
jgi:hypothetical protein